jgi:hypothetical protein
MDEDERLDYFLSRAIECEEVWSLGSDCGWSIREEGEQRVIPVWPHQELANLCACGDCERQRPDPVSLEHFLYRVLAMMKENGILVEVLPSTDRPGRLMPAEALFEALDSKLDSGESLLGR